MGLRDYMAAMDSADATTALEWLNEELNYHIALPGGASTGSSREDFRAYIAGRGSPVARVHNIVRHQVDGDTEMVVGTVTEGGLYTGSFLSAAVIDDHGRLLRYESYFTPEFQLHPWPTDTE